MRRCSIGLLLLALALQQARSVAAQEERDWREAPTIAARAAAVVDAESGALLWGLNAHERRAQASLTKIVTALVAVKRWDLARPIRATELSRVEPSVIGMEPGDVLLLRDALYGLLLNSGNDAALAIAETVGRGSIPRFVGWMNEWASEHGLHDTHFENPHGLDAPGHFSSAYDVALASRALLQDQFLATVVSTDRYRVDGPPQWQFRNTNPLLGKYPGIDGVKTGFEVNAGRCIAVSATRDGHRLIVVLLHDDDYPRDAAALLDWAFATFRWWEVALPDPATGQTVRETVALRLDRERFLRIMVELERAERRAA